MTTETWEPQPTSSYSFDREILQRIILLMKNSGDVNGCLNQEEQSQHRPLMTMSMNEWQLLANELSDEDILLLIRFFTLAEMQLPTWVGGERSSVIGLAKIYRRRVKTLDKSLLQWIKQTSNNKFLPYGPL